jgi:phosphatidylserine decarboxylase
MQSHSFVVRETGALVEEKLYSDLWLRFLYSQAREHAPTLFRLVTGPRLSDLVACLHFDLPLSSRLLGPRFVRSRFVDLEECADPPESLKTARELFERKIRYWDCRPMPQDTNAVVAPSDSKVVVGSCASSSLIFLKGKFFDFEELLGVDKIEWRDRFDKGDFAVFRLTPEKYHYNHTPVAGQVVDFYEISGSYHSCHPRAVVNSVTPFSKNKRVVTIFDTDIPGGTQVGHAAMVEVVALGIGEIEQRYSEIEYLDPREIQLGLVVKKGVPKSLFRPGSSTNVLIFEPGRVCMSEDIVSNMAREGAQSLYSIGFGKPLVETDVQVRSPIAFGKSSRKEGASGQ